MMPPNQQGFLSTRKFIDPLGVLPDELSLHVLGYLDHESLSQASQISRSWRSICLDDHLWRRIYLEEDYFQNDLSQPHTGRLQRNIGWHFLWQQRRKTQHNWTHGYSSTFLLPSPTRPWEGHTQQVLAIHQQGQTLVSGGQDRTIRRWNLDSKRLVGPPLRGHTGAVTALQCDVTADLIVSGCDHSSVIMWRLSSGQLLQKKEHAHTKAITSVCFDSRVIVTGSRDTSIKVWSHIRSSPLLCKVTHDKKVDCNTVSQSKREQQLPLILISELKGHIGSVRSLNISHGQVISASGDHTTKIWDPFSGQCLRSFGDPNVVTFVNLNGCNTFGGGRSGRMNIIDHATKDNVAFLNGDNDLLLTAHASQNSAGPARIVTGSLNGIVTVWKTTSSLEWAPAYRLDAAKSVNECLTQLETARAHVLGMRKTEVNKCTNSRTDSREFTMRLRGSRVFSHISSNRVVKPRTLSRPSRKSIVYSAVLDSTVVDMTGEDAAQVASGNDHQEQILNQAESQNPPDIEVSRARVCKVQFDETRIICCTGESTILGWDFTNENLELEQARRFIQRLPNISCCSR